jgi:hypothetical protein
MQEQTNAAIFPKDISAIVGEIGSMQSRNSNPSNQSGKVMDELKHLAAWVKEQHAEGYILTWLLTQPGLWWCNGEIYQAALLKDGDRLKEIVRQNEQSPLLQGITEKLDHEEGWNALAASLTRVFDVYQAELTKLQDARRQRDMSQRKAENSKGKSKAKPQSNQDDEWSPLDVQQPLPAPYSSDPITGDD